MKFQSSSSISSYPWFLLVVLATNSAIADAFTVIRPPSSSSSLSSSILRKSQRPLLPPPIPFGVLDPRHHPQQRPSSYLVCQQSNNKNDNNQEQPQPSQEQKQPQDPWDLISTTSTTSITSESLSNGLASVLTPWEDWINESTDGWGLTYADLSPETESTPLGVGFLATNVAYALTGLLLTWQGDVFYGCVTELAGVVSFWYHYSQLKHGQLNARPVQLALMVDYMTAAAALMCTGFYLVTFPQGFGQIPGDALVAGIAGLTSLGLCWVWEMGYPYLFWHSLWHLLSAYAGYTVGQAHLAAFT